MNRKTTTLESYKHLFGLIVVYWKWFLLAGVLMVFNAVFDGASLSMIVPIADRVLSGKPIAFPYKLPSLMQGLIDRLNQIDRETMLLYTGIFIVVVFLLKAVTEFLYKYIMTDIGQRIIRDLRQRIYEKLQGLSMDFFSRYRSGELISKVMNDVAIIENSVAYGVTELIYQGAQVLVFAGIIFFINYKLALWLFVIFPLVLFPILRIGRLLKKITHKTQERIADINSLLFETISGIKIIKAFATEDYELRRFSKNNDDYYRLTMKAAGKRLIVSPMLELIGAIAAVAILWWGGRLVLEGRFSFGVFGLFLAALLSMLRPLKRLSNVHLFYQRALAAIDRIYEILNQRPSIVDKDYVRPFSFENEIRFNGVWFSYNGCDWVLKDINMAVKKGAVVAIVGPSGSGKSTIANLLLRLYDPQRGAVKIDGIDIKDFAVRELRRHIGIVTQDTVLFNASIEENIRYGSWDVSQEDIVRAAKLANAHDFIVSFPEGYRTNIGDLGSRLSGGQRQRLAIARAIVKDPEILILDEATSHLDLQAEKEVQIALQNVVKNRTVIVIAHRLSTVKDADTIFVLHHGRLVEEGRHTELMEKNSLYASLYKLQ